MSNNTPEQQDTLFNEWSFKVWSDRRDWCKYCNKVKNKLVFDDQTKTTTCSQCGHIETYDQAGWKVFQTKRYISSQYLSGKHFFGNLSKEEIFQKYIRTLNHNDWSSWLMHDYLLARMKNEKAIQDKLIETAQQVIEKMSYDPKPWKTFFEKLDAPNPEIFYQVPQTIYEFVEKKLKETLPNDDFSVTLEGYVTTLTSLYSYSRSKGDRITCWITSEIIKLCDTDPYSIEFYTALFECDPLLDNFIDDLVEEKKRVINVKDSYIQWQLNLADKFLQQSKALVAVQAAYDALTAKLGIHALWPPTKTISFDANTVKKVCEIVNDPELFRFYDLATDLNSIDAAKACYYAKYFIESVKKLLPNVTSIEKEMEKQVYIT
ncbi:MAG: hypothetical protein LBC03_01970 [Nitrososphaerota archaeon]|jgi:translation initiation factor 2 beta subunit (eIF-2beta)/eIF-5|nr:hypothetical protein [Nitrososphaerota archaeon]